MKHQLLKKITAPFTWAIRGVAGKTSWEWLELLIVPLFLAAGAFYLETRVEKRQADIAEERAKQGVLDSYLEKMQGLLLDRGLRESSEDSEVRSVARAITTTAIRELGAERNALLVAFLQESALISDGSGEEDINESVSLLQGLNLRFSSLSGADLSEANLRAIYLALANLSNADLSEANLSEAKLMGVNLSGADLRKANLSNADLFDAKLPGADLSNADLSNTYLGLADLLDADLSHVNNLSEDQLETAIICRTNLPEDFSLDPDRDCEKR